MTLLITCWTRRLWWTGSAGTGLTWAAARRGTSYASSGLDAVWRAGLLAIAHSGGVKGAADHLVAKARQVLDPSAAHQHHRVLLEIVALAGNVGADLHAVGQPHAGHLAQRRVGLLGRGGVHARAHAAALGCGHLLLATLARFQSGRSQLLLRRGTPFADQLAGGRHAWARVAGGYQSSRRSNSSRLSSIHRACPRLRTPCWCSAISRSTT